MGGDKMGKEYRTATTVNFVDDKGEAQAFTPGKKVTESDFPKGDWERLVDGGAVLVVGADGEDDYPEEGSTAEQSANVVQRRQMGITPDPTNKAQEELDRITEARQERREKELAQRVKDGKTAEEELEAAKAEASKSNTATPPATKVGSTPTSSSTPKAQGQK
jgi:hypothetical protein